MSRFFYRLIRFEYWPFSIFYIPVYFYFTWLAIRNRSFFFFTASNPNIEFGGMLGESKKEIFDQIPAEYIPITLRFEPEVTIKEIELHLRSSAINYPLICKPDIGERGWMVEKITDVKELTLYLEKIKVPFLVQEFIDYPIELGVFYIRRPSKKTGEITSLVRKEFLSVTGDGTSSVRELLYENRRAELNFDLSSAFHRYLLDHIPKKNEKFIVEPIGNHCRGTTFFDESENISTKLVQQFDKIARRIPEFYFGRFDLRCRSIAELEEGRNFRILELNGAGSEPGHIYQPGYPILKAYGEIMRHLRLLGEISRENKNNGHKFWTIGEGLRKLRQINRYNRTKD